MSVVNIPTAATGYRQSIIRDAQGAQRVVNRMQMSPTLNPSGIIQPLGRITNSASEFQKSMDASAARVFAFGAAVGVINGVSEAFRAMIAATAEVEKSLKDIQVVMEASNSAMQKFGDGLFDVARNTATSFKDVAESATELARQGLSAEETLARVNSALILSRLSGLDAVKSTETLTAAINSFNKEGVTHSEIVNRMANVDAAFAVSSADLAEAISRAGAVAQSSGVSFNQLAAVVTAVQQRTARGGSVIGNGFKSIFTRIKRSGVREALEEIGVATKNNDGSFRDSMSVILDYADVYKNLSDSQKAYTAEQLAGVYQIQNLQALIQDLNSGYSIYNKALGVANNTTNEAIQRNKDLNTTLSAMFTQTQLSAKELASSLGELALSGNFKEILTFLNNLAQKLNDLLSEDGGNNLAKNLVRGIGSFLTGPGMVILGAAFLKIFGLVTKFAKEAFSDILGLNKESKRQQSLQAAIGQVLSTNSGIYQKILAAGSNTAKQEQIILNLIRQETAERIKQEALIKRIAASSRLVGIGASESGFVPMGKKTAQVRGRKVLGMSNGFLPAFNREQRDINTGVGGARKSDKPVLLKNHKMGGGKVNDVVAHTGEWTVRNFKGSGGTAIFNRDMASAYGLPSGAKKINASSGFIPNFAKFTNESHTMTSAQLGGSQAGKGPISRLSDMIDSFTGRIKVAKMDFTNKDLGKNATDIVRGNKAQNIPGLIEPDPKALRVGRTKYRVNKKAIGMLNKRYGNLVKDGPYAGIVTTAKSISDSKYNNYKTSQGQPDQIKDYFKSVTGLLKGVEGEHQSIKYLANSGLKNVKPIQGAGSFDLAAKNSKGKKTKMFEVKAKEKQNVVVGLKKAADQYLKLKAITQKNSGQDPIGIKNGRPDKINLTSGNALFAGGINMLTAADTKLSANKISPLSEENKKFKQEEVFKQIKSFTNLDFKDRQALYKDKTNEEIWSKARKALEDKPKDQLNFYLRSLQSKNSEESEVVKNYLKNLIKKKEDRNSKAHSLFLDPNYNIPLGGIRNAVNGFVPNFMVKRPGMGKSGSVYSIRRGKDRVLNVSHIRANEGEFGSTIYRNLINEIVNAAKSGNPYTKIDAGSIIGPRIPRALLAAKKILDRKRITQNIPKLELEGVLVPQQLRRRVEEFRQNNYTRSGGKFNTEDSAEYLPGEESKLIDSLRRIGLGRNAHKRKNLVRLENLPIGKNFSDGFIPNFAKNALSEAINREREAGVPQSRIRVERSPDLVSKHNPMGLAVTNTRDEPLGLNQGIRRAKMEGVNPKTYGSGRNTTPNFAAGVQTTKGFFTTQRINRLKDGDFAKDSSGNKVYLNMFSPDDQKKILGFRATHSKENIAKAKQVSRDKKNKTPLIDASTQATMLVATNNLRRRVDTKFKTDKGDVRLKYRVEGLKPGALKNTEGKIRDRIGDLMLKESTFLAKEMSGAGKFGMNVPNVTRMANAGSIGSASGSIFETALQTVGKNKLFTRNNASFDIAGTPDEKLQKLFGYYTPYADAKIGLNPDTKRDFNQKVLKIPQNAVQLSKTQKTKQAEVSRATRKSYGPLTRATVGYIPNFAKLTKRQKQDFVNSGFAKNHREANAKYNFRDHHYLIEKKLSNKEWLKQKAFDRDYAKMTGVTKRNTAYYGTYPGSQRDYPVQQSRAVARNANIGAKGAAMSTGMVSQLNSTVQGLVNRVSNIEKQLNIENLSKGYIPNFALPARHKDIRKNDEPGVGFIESMVKEEILSGNKYFNDELKDVAGNKEIAVDVRKKEIAIGGKPISSKDLKRIYFQPDAKNILFEKFASQLFKFQRQSGIAELVNLFNPFSKGPTQLQKKQNQMGEIARANSRFFETTNGGRYYLNREGFNQLVTAKGGAINFDDFINQTIINSNAAMEKRNQLQASNPKKGGRGLDLSWASPGNIVKSATEFGQLVADKSIAMGGKFTNVVGDVSAKAGNIIKYSNQYLMTGKEKAVDMLARKQQKALEKTLQAKEAIETSKLNTLKNRSNAIQNATFRATSPDGTKYKDLKFAGTDADMYLDKRPRNISYYSKSTGQNVDFPWDEDPNQKRVARLFDVQNNAKEQLERRQARIQEIKNMIQDQKKYGTYFVDKTGKFLKASTIDLPKAVAKGIAKPFIAAAGPFKQGDFTRGIVETLSHVKETGARAVSVVTSGLTEGLNEKYERFKDPFRKIKASGTKKIKQTRDFFAGSKDQEGVNSKVFKLMQKGFGKGVDSLKDLLYVFENYDEVSNTGKKRGPSIFSKTYNKLRGVQYGQLGGRIKDGVQWAGEKLISPLTYYGRRGVNKTKDFAMEQIPKIQEKYTQFSKFKNQKFSKAAEIFQKNKKKLGIAGALGAGATAIGLGIKGLGGPSGALKAVGGVGKTIGGIGKTVGLGGGAGSILGDILTTGGIASGTALAGYTAYKYRDKIKDLTPVKYLRESISGVPVKIGNDKVYLKREDAKHFQIKNSNVKADFAAAQEDVMDLLSGRKAGTNDDVLEMEKKLDKIRIQKQAIDDFYKKHSKKIVPRQKSNRFSPKSRFRRGGFAEGFVPNFSKLANLILAHNKKVQASKPLGDKEYSSLSGRIADFNKRVQSSGKSSMKNRPITSLDRKQPFKISRRNRLEDLDNVKRFMNSDEFKMLDKNLQSKLLLYYNKRKSEIASLKDLDPQYLRHSSDPMYQGKIANYGNGFMPNFALDQAIARESEALKKRGISSNKIKVEKSSYLKSVMNPIGLAVTNAVDEPMGVQQGINRVKKQGLNPKTYGVPSFALSPEEKRLEKEKADFKLEQERKQGRFLGRSQFLNPYAGLDDDEAFKLKKDQEAYKKKTKGTKGIKRYVKHGMSPEGKRRMSIAGSKMAGASMGAMFMGPMAAEMIRDGREDAAIGGGGRMGMDVMNSAALGAAFGPWGMALGAGYGVGKGITEFGQRDKQANTFKALEGAKKKLDEIMSDTSSMQSFAQGVQELHVATQSGDSKGIVAANKQIRQSINNIADPEVRKRMQSLAKSSMSSSKKLELLGAAIGNMGEEAEKRSSMLAAGKSANDERFAGANGFQDSWFGTGVQGTVAGVKTAFDFLTGNGNTFDYNMKTLGGEDAFQGNLGAAKDQARSLNKAFKAEAKRMARENLYTDLSKGKGPIAAPELVGKTNEEIELMRQNDVGLDAKLSQEQDIAYAQLYKDTIKQFMDNKKLSDTDIGKNLKQLPGGEESFENFDRQATFEDGSLATFGGAILKEFADTALDAKDGLEGHSEAIKAAIETQQKIVNLEQKLLSEYQNMLQAQQNVNQMMSRFATNQGIGSYRQQTDSMVRTKANDYLTERNYIDPRQYIARDAGNQKRDIIAEGESGMRREFMNLIAGIDVTKMFNPSATEKKEMNIKDPSPTSGTGAFQQKVDQRESQADQQLARALADFAAQNKDGNVTLNEMKGFLGKIDRTGMAGNRIASAAKDIENATSQKMIAQLERLAVTTMIREGEAASGRLAQQGGKRLGDGEIKAGVDAAVESDKDIIDLAGNYMSQGSLPGDSIVEGAADSIDAFRQLAAVMGVSSTLFTGLNDDTSNYLTALANVNGMMEQLENFDPEKAAELKPVFEKIKSSLDADYKTTQIVAEELKRMAGEGGVDPNLVKDPIKALTVQLGNLWGQGLKITNLQELTTPLTQLLTNQDGNGDGSGSPITPSGTPVGTSDDSTPRGTEGTEVDFSSAIKALEELPSQISSQLSELVINHEVTGGITFDFNSDVVQGVLTPVMRDQLKNILQEGVILDYLATALKKKVDPQGVLE